MPDLTEMFKIAQAAGGVGGLLAVFIVYVYIRREKEFFKDRDRRDRELEAYHKQVSDDRERHDRELAELNRMTLDALRHNTEAMVGLKEMLRDKVVCPFEQLIKHDMELQAAAIRKYQHQQGD